MKRLPRIWYSTGYTTDGFHHLKWNGVEWLGVCVENQASADVEIPRLLAKPAAKRFVIYEPTGPVDFFAVTDGKLRTCDFSARNTTLGDLDWLIIVGVSGCDLGWIRSAIGQAKHAVVPVWVKQIGSRPLARSVDDFGPDIFREWDSKHANEPFPVSGVVFGWHSRKGSDPSEWPEDLRVREVPT